MGLETPSQQAPNFCNHFLPSQHERPWDTAPSPPIWVADSSSDAQPWRPDPSTTTTLSFGALSETVIRSLGFCPGHH